MLAPALSASTRPGRYFHCKEQLRSNAARFLQPAVCIEVLGGSKPDPVGFPTPTSRGIKAASGVPCKEQEIYRQACTRAVQLRKRGGHLRSIDHEYSLYFPSTTRLAAVHGAPGVRPMRPQGAVLARAPPCRIRSRHDDAGPAPSPRAVPAPQRSRDLLRRLLRRLDAASAR
jgi:hypothetical protein